MKLEPLDEARTPADDVSSSLDKIIRQEELEQVLDATAQLSDLTRAVVIMRYIEQQSYEQIGERLGKKPQHMRSVCAKGLARLRTVLADRELTVFRNGL